ncbi:MAG: DUF1206 domain-containing protein [Sinobacteraceae bacterium]|nr:DUF1206 domain-containing protein [Nevskiaceae bacterium]MBV9911207.1 DUF1206 domain-containing protein [Nevskiaceae bacterium]
METRDAAEISAWERWIAHAGYVSEGLLYLLIGSFALLATMEGGRRPDGTQGVLIKLSLTPPGELLLAAVALGLTSFVTWQLLIALRDPEHRRGREPRSRRMVRVGYMFSAALHSVIVIEAMRILFGFGHTASGERTQKVWIARAFGVPFGRYVVGAVGVGILLYGLYQCYRALTPDKDKRVDLTRTRLRPIMNLLGVYGLLARGAMFALIGIYLLRAAWGLQAKYAIGVAGALGALRQQPYGEWLLGTVAAGLMTYGIWQIVKEPFRRLADS